MDNTEVEKTVVADEGSQLNRNRSFKSKQLVRSQAIRESTSPPRTISPTVRSDDSNSRVNAATNATLSDSSHEGESFKSKQLVRSQAIRESTSPPRTISPTVRSDDSNSRVNAATNATLSDSSHEGEVFAYDKHSAKQRVEIQITSGSWEPEHSWSSRRSRRWAAPPTREARGPRDLLSNNPRVACVCGACGACPQCRGRRRRPVCPTKQDSGIVCSEDGADCSDSEQNGSTNDLKKSASGSIDTDDQYICRCADRRDKPKSISLSRTDSDDKSEPAGPELVAFIKETLNKNARDRTTLLTIERELHSLINDPGRCIVKFPVMTSYGRMLVHRCAALFQLAHHLDQNNKTCVVVSKSGTSGGRVPCTGFKSWCVASLPPSPARHAPDQQNAKSILKRDTHSLDEPSLGANAMSRSKSLEQREKDYERVRRRIFSSDETQWPWHNAGAPVKLLTPEHGRNKLLKVQSLENPSGPPVSGRGGAVSKSHSFGGYGDQPQPRALSRQGDLASSSWRLSPSSSGYKTLSLRSTDSVTPSPTGGGTPEPSTASIPTNPSGALVWAVTDLAAVPRGAVVIHPQTGRPLTNPDGSVYHFDPANPPILYDPGIHNDGDQDKIDPNNEKRRGRLEKQDSFMDNESECQSTENCINKCCCECRKSHTQQQQTQQNTQQHPQQQSTMPVENTMEKESSKPPPSPKYDIPIQNHAEPTNHSKPADAPTNHKPPDSHQDQATNQRYENPIPNNRGFEATNQREHVKVNQDIVHYSQPYPHPYNSEELTSPPQVNPYFHQEMSLVPHGKIAPNVLDPNLRPMSLSNMMYPAAIPQAYPAYIPNHRMEQLNQPMYQAMVPQMEEHKQISTPPQQQETTFRIDPSYPFPAVDYACCDPAQMQPHPPPQRSYSVPYNQVEVAAMPTLMPPAYPAPNILLPPPVQQYPVQYQEPVQWAHVQAPVGPKLFDVCPVVYPHYTHYNVVYPQVVPQAYPICQPVYQVPEVKPDPPYQRKRTSLPPTARNTPLSAPDDKHDDKQLHRQDSTEIAAKIQQIKEQMAEMKTRGNTNERRDGNWRRNSGHGILGSAPHHYQRPNDENQLSTAARDIINSLRNMQAKNTYQQDRRYENQSYNRNYERNDNSYRNRRHEVREHDKQDRSHGNSSTDRQDMNGKGDADRKVDRYRVNQLNLSYRPPYLFRQMSPSTWCRRSPAPLHPTMNHPRRPHPDNRPRR